MINKGFNTRSKNSYFVYYFPKEKKKQPENTFEHKAMLQKSIQGVLVLANFEELAQAVIEGDEDKAQFDAEFC